MKRILGMVVATAAVLAFGTVAGATQVTFDLGGVTGAWSRSGDTHADGPPSGGLCGATGLGSTSPGQSQDCFRYAFTAGSSITVDIVGSAVTMIGGSLEVHTSSPLDIPGVSVATDSYTTIYGATAYTPAAVGTLSGNSILWSTAANFNTVGTLTCSGASCSFLGGLPDGIPVPISVLYSLTNSSPVTALVLGQWDLNGALDQILGSSTAVYGWSNVVADGNRRVGGYTFGAGLLGQPVPEPGAAALVLLGLGALALRSRKA